MTRLPERPEPGSPADWMASAESDLAYARIGMDHARELRLEQVCFHAQQAAEKAIKAVLAGKQAGFPHTHDLTVLVEICRRNSLSMGEVLEHAADLTPYAVESRYPGATRAVTPQEADEAVKVAGAVLQWARGAVAS